MFSSREAGFEDGGEGEGIRSELWSEVAHASSEVFDTRAPGRELRNIHACCPLCTVSRASLQRQSV